MALLAVVFVRLALNPEILVYEPRSALRIFNWYLYTYLTCAAAFFAGRLAAVGARTIACARAAAHLAMLPAAGDVLLFLLLNIEIADFYSTGRRSCSASASLAQDLTYTIGWLVFGLLLLAAGIYLEQPPARIAAVALIAVTTFKCFLYDLSRSAACIASASFVGLAISLALVSLALQKFVLSKPRSANDDNRCRVLVAIGVRSVRSSLVLAQTVGDSRRSSAQS